MEISSINKNQVLKMIRYKQVKEKPPELEIPEIEDPRERLNVQIVKYAAFVNYKPDDESDVEQIPVVRLDDDNWYSLPIEYTEWVKEMLAMAHLGGSLFPAKIDFSIFNGRYCAEYIKTKNDG